MHKLSKFLILTVLFFCLIAFSPGRTAAAWPPDSAYIDGVIGHPQQRALSCESRSASDFAAFFGYSVSEAQILALVTKSPRTDNPNYGFAGNPDGAWGKIPPHDYGVHSNPIEGALLKHGLPVYGERNLTWDFLRSEIASGKPVIVWIIGAMWPGTPVEYTDSLGRKALVAAYEHTVILIGYDSDAVWIVDASDGLTKTYPLASFLTSWQVLQNQAVFFHVKYTDLVYLPFVIGLGSEAAQDTGQEIPPAKPAPISKSYIVRSGDLLGQIAHQYGIPWERLVEINSLSPPFTLFPGQEIRLQQ